jgi:hypothetical protein
MAVPCPSRRLVIGALPTELSLARVAFELGVSKNTIDNWRRVGRGKGTAPLPAYRCPRTRQWVIPLHALQTWLGLTADSRETITAEEEHDDAMHTEESTTGEQRDAGE